MSGWSRPAGRSSRVAMKSTSAFGRIEIVAGFPGFGLLFGLRLR